MHARARGVEDQRTSLSTTTTPYLPRNPPPAQIALLYGLYSCILYYYLYLFCFVVFYLTLVLIRFVKPCVCRDIFTTRARNLMMANKGRNM